MAMWPELLLSIRGGLEDLVLNNTMAQIQTPDQKSGVFSYGVGGERGPAAHGKVAVKVGGGLDGRLVAVTPVVKKALFGRRTARTRDEAVLVAAWTVLCTTYRVWIPSA